MSLVWGSGAWDSGFRFRAQGFLFRIKLWFPHVHKFPHSFDYHNYLAVLCAVSNVHDSHTFVIPVTKTRS